MPLVIHELVMVIKWLCTFHTTYLFILQIDYLRLNPTLNLFFRFFLVGFDTQIKLNPTSNLIQFTFQFVRTGFYVFSLLVSLSLHTRGRMACVMSISLTVAEYLSWKSSVVYGSQQQEWWIYFFNLFPIQNKAFVFPNYWFMIMIRNCVFLLSN